MVQPGGFYERQIGSENLPAFFEARNQNAAAFSGSQYTGVSQEKAWNTLTQFFSPNDPLGYEVLTQSARALTSSPVEQELTQRAYAALGNSSPSQPFAAGAPQPQQQNNMMPMLMTFTP